MTLPYAEPYKIKMTEAIRTSTRAEREAWIREARYNLFKLRSDQVTIDLLTDSGTGSMSDRQWAAMMTGDESYAGASSYFRLKETIESIFGMPYFLPTHQGRAAENVIFSALLKAGDIVPGNSHFDTTKGHIEFRHCHAVDCTIDDAADTQKELPFKGEMDIAKLEKILRENPREKVPCVVLTITNNTAGGQPVSMRNIRETAEVCRRYGVPLLLDSARFAENAYFIKTREEGYADKTIKEIVREIYTYADIMTISAKKDGVVNMGGFVAMRSEELYRQAMTFSIMFEGYVTYGGMSGRDMAGRGAGRKYRIRTARRPHPPGEAAGRPVGRLRRTLPAAGRRTRHLRRCEKSAPQPAEGTVYRPNARRGTLFGGGNPRRGDRLDPR